MLSRYKQKIEPFLRLIAYPLIKKGINPDIITLTGLAASIIYLISVKIGASLVLIAPLYISSLILDGLDGVVARALGKVSKFGAFLDSSIDRITDTIYSLSLLELGIANLYEYTVLLMGSFLVSYSRARAEGLNVEMAGTGIGERLERSVLIFLAIIFSFFNVSISRIILYFLIIITHITFIQRITKVYRETKVG